MINRKRNILLALVLTIFLGGVFVIIFQKEVFNVEDFELSDYRHYIKNFSSEEDVGSIADSKDAIKEAEKVWIKLYGESIKKEKPYQVFYDEKSGVWLVQGSIRPNMKGGVAHILIRDNGKVLAVWHEK